MRISQKRIYKLNYGIPEDKNSNFDIMDKIKEFLDVKNINNIKRIKENSV